MDSSKGAFAIYLRGGEDFVSVNIEQDPLNSVLYLLKQESQPFSLWMNIAMAYYIRGRKQEFERVLSTVLETAKGEERYRRDIVPLLNAYGSYLVTESTKICDADRCKAQLDLARRHFDEAIRIATAMQVDAPGALVGIGFIHLLLGELGQAKKELEDVIESSTFDVSIPALLGRGLAAFHEADFAGALGFFRRIAACCVKTPVPIRLAVGYCQLGLGNLQRAEMAFMDVIHEDKGNAEGHLGLFLVLLFSDIPDRISRALLSLEIAYALAPTHPVILNLIADRLFFLGEAEHAERCATVAKVGSSSSSIQAEALFQIARVRHSGRDWSASASAYQQALTLDPTHHCARLGLAQLSCQRGNFARCLELCEELIRGGQLAPDVSRLLAYANARLGRVEQALALYGQIIDRFLDDVDVVVDYAGLLLYCDNEKALRLFQTALGIYEDLESKVPLPVLNNVGVLHLLRGDAERAASFFRRGLEAVSALPNAADAGYTVTLKFNQARSLEKMSQKAEAEQLLIEIVKEYPLYTPAFIRLAGIASSDGRRQTALTWLHALLEMQPTDRSAMYMLGCAYLEQLELDRAQTVFSSMQKLDPGDEYALLGLALVYFSVAYRERDAVKREKHMTYASQLLENTLKKHPDNLYAANNIGAVLGERGYIQDAYSCFTRVRETAKTFGLPELLVNLAHISLAVQQYGQATSLYENALLMRPKDPIYLSYQAKALLDSEKFEQAEAILRDLIEEVEKKSADFSRGADAVPQSDEALLLPPPPPPQHPESEQALPAAGDSRGAAARWYSLCVLYYNYGVILQRHAESVYKDRNAQFVRLSSVRCQSCIELLERARLFFQRVEDGSAHATGVAIVQKASKRLLALKEDMAHLTIAVENAHRMEEEAKKKQEEEFRLHEQRRLRRQQSSLFGKTGPVAGGAEAATAAAKIQEQLAQLRSEVVSSLQSALVVQAARRSDAAKEEDFIVTGDEQADAGEEPAASEGTADPSKKRPARKTAKHRRKSAGRRRRAAAAVSDEEEEEAKEEETEEEEVETDEGKAADAVVRSESEDGEEVRRAGEQGGDAGEEGGPEALGTKRGRRRAPRRQSQRRRVVEEDEEAEGEAQAHEKEGETDVAEPSPDAADNEAFMTDKEKEVMHALETMMRGCTNIEELNTRRIRSRLAEQFAGDDQLVGGLKKAITSRLYRLIAAGQVPAAANSQDTESQPGPASAQAMDD